MVVAFLCLFLTAASKVSSIEEVGVVRRQVGYSPAYGNSGSGATCEDAYGPQWEQCSASTELALFCFNPSIGQTCCADGNGSMFANMFYGPWM